MDGGAWKAAVHGVAESRTQLSDFTFAFHFHALEKEMAPHSSALAWRIPGTGSLVGCRLWGHTESGATEAAQQQQQQQHKAQNQGPSAKSWAFCWRALGASAGHGHVTGGRPQTWFPDQPSARPAQMLLMCRPEII